MNEISTLREIASSAIAEVEHWKGLMAIAIKQSGGTFVIKKSSSDVESPYEIVMRRIDEEGTVESAEIELRLLEGKDQIEEVLGKSSPLIIPK